MKFNFNIAAINQCTESEGPFKRLAIWFQGCNIQCSDCCNPKLFALKKANIVSLENLIQIISSAQKEFGIEGVTYLGGEPTMQQGLSRLSSSLKQLDLGIILFTGKLYEELDPELIQNIDLIIDGQFEKDKIDTERNLIGSKNQRLMNITKRYSKHLDWFYNLRPKQVEFNISGKITVTGDYINHD